MKGRKTADYMCAITSAIARDIRSQQVVFDELSQISNGARELSHVRLLDILAWQAGGIGL